MLDITATPSMQSEKRREFDSCTASDELRRAESVEESLVSGLQGAERERGDVDGGERVGRRQPGSQQSPEVGVYIIELWSRVV